ncbi:hypothetical protein OUY24_04070, partial [Nonomuraea ferruginea]|nr:hypothetical protein [Nonomuraea ferruginea]
PAPGPDAALGMGGLGAETAASGIGGPSDTAALGMDAIAAKTGGAGESVSGAGGAASGKGGARPRRKRMVFVAVGAVVASLLATAATAFDGYQFYESVTTRGLYPKQVTVPAGGSYEVYKTEFKAAVAPTDPPKDNKHGPEVTWLAIDIRKKVLDEDSATMVAEPTDLELTDRAGRTWVVELIPGDRPTDRLVVGQEYRIQGVAVVPTEVKDEVELSFRPSSYRSDTPIDDLFKKDSEAVRIDNLVELTFRRR